MVKKVLKQNEIVCENTYVANNLLSRTIGLLGRKSFGDIDGLILSPCSQIHSFGMKFEFDALYLDKNYKIMALFENIKKNRILPYNFGTKYVLELPMGTISAKKLELEDVLKIIEE